MDLVSGYAFLAPNHQEKSRKPFTKWDLGTLEYGPDRYRELLSAGVALIQTRAMGFAMQQAGLIDRPAMRTDATRRPNSSLKPFAGLIVIGENGLLKDGGGHVGLQ